MITSASETTRTEYRLIRAWSLSDGAHVIQVHSTIALSFVKVKFLFVCTSVPGFVLFLLLLYFFTNHPKPPLGQIHLLAASIRTGFFFSPPRLHLFVRANLWDSNSEDIGLHNVRVESFLFSLEAWGKKRFSLWSGVEWVVAVPRCLIQTVSSE